LVDHLVLFAVREGASAEEVEDLLASIRGLKDEVPGVVDLSVGKDFTGRAGEYTHALFARFEDRDGLKAYLEHPDHLVIVEKLGERTSGRIVVDYEH